jgi:hypothetical protein
MDKAAIIFSILTHDYELMLWFWGLITLPVGFWHTFYFPAKKQFTAKQLEEISPTFKDIDSDYLVYSLFGIGIFMMLPAMVMLNQLDDWSVLQFGMRFYPGVLSFTVGYALYQAVFALIKGVYPMGRMLSYAYDDASIIRRIAKYQIIIALLALILVTLFFFTTAG